MSRQLLQQALDALTNGVDCMVEQLENMERWEIRKRGDAARAEINSAQSAIEAITAALAQPEPVRLLKDNGSPRHPLDIQSDPFGLAMFDSNKPVRAYTTAPPAPDAEQLRKDLASMTAQRDWMAMRYDALEAGSAADRLDAQRYRWVIAAERNSEILYAVVMGNWPDAVEIAREIDAAKATGGQP